MGPQTLRGSTSWHIATCSLALQMSGLFHMVLSQALKTKLKRSASLCILLPVHYILLVKLWHNEVAYCLRMRDLCNCSLQKRACSTHVSISSSKMEWACLCICRLGYRFILLAKYHELPETSWARSSISLSLFALRIFLHKLRDLVSVAVPLLKDMLYVLLIKIRGRQTSVGRSKVQSTFRGKLTSFVLANVLWKELLLKNAMHVSSVVLICSLFSFWIKDEAEGFVLLQRTCHSHVDPSAGTGSALYFPALLCPLSHRLCLA